MLEIFLQNFLSPPILFFFLGVTAGFVKSDLQVPDQIGRYLSIYLMMAIGFRGGVALSETPEFNSEVLLTIFFGILTGFTQPFIGYMMLRLSTKLDKITAAAVAAHYGSISMVTFVTAVSFLEIQHVVYAGYIVAVLALMETPAILSALYIVRTDHKKGDHKKKANLWREIFTNGSVMLLTGAFIIGYLTSTKGALMMQGFLKDPFQGILSFFLLDMGLVVARELHHLQQFNLRMFLFAIYMPLIGASVGLGLSKFIGLGIGTGTLFTVLVASSSYIAVTAAMRLALPEAKAGIYIPMSLGITFPFNITVGIPLYFLLAKCVLGT